MTGMKLGYIIIYVPDVAAAVAFYREAFGFTVRFAPDSGDYAELETGSTALAFAAHKLVSDQGIHFTAHSNATAPAAMEVAFVTDDVPEALQRAQHAGAVLVKPPVTKPWGQLVAYVRDLNGVLIELCSPLPSIGE